MNQIRLFAQSALVSVMGMGMVFAFLLLLVCVVRCVGALVSSFGWDRGPDEGVGAAVPAGGALAAAIAVAVHEKARSTS